MLRGVRYAMLRARSTWREVNIVTNSMLKYPRVLILLQCTISLELVRTVFYRRFPVY